jgi:hypothetical protein
MKIQDGTVEQHPHILPIDTSATPGVAGITPTSGCGVQQAGSMDNQAAFASLAASGEAAAREAMASGMAADADRRGRYGAALSNSGHGETGDALLFPQETATGATLDPGVAPGITSPSGGQYDPPRNYGG